MLLKSRLGLKALRWASVTGSLLGCDEERGALDLEPCVALFSELLHGAEFTMCHSFRPRSYVLREPPATEPVLYVVMKCNRSHSGMGICRFSWILKWSQK